MKATLLLASLAIAAVASAAGQTYLEETFSDSNWEERWTTSSFRKDLGKFALSSGTFYPDKEYAQGLQTTEDHRFYSISTPLSTVADNAKEDLIVQYTVKQEVAQECGGSYLKLLPEGYDAAAFNGDSEYAIMFGPDMCGSENRIHVIFNYKGQNYLTKQHFPVPKDTRTHFYRLTVHPDQKYSLVVDGEVKADHIPLEEHWSIYPARVIADPNDKKPEGWVDLKEIEDPTHVKPEGYDDIPRYIPDPEAKQPEDWDVESDGDWEAPEITNPDFEEWTQKFIPNPEYKGEWKAKEIPNPEFKEDPELAHYKIGGVGFDLWQVKSGSIFDDIIITSDAEVADKYLNQWQTNFEKEKELKAEMDAKEAAAKKDEETQTETESESDKKHEAEADELDEEDEKVEPEADGDVEGEQEKIVEADVEVEEEEEEEPAAEEPEEEVKKETKKESKEETKHDEL
ncbi:MAG: Calreticulin family-domain-containing protein [Benniella sp.]|nr:MAG: Calreticulin family-domain-containing protein [Benniella sp.]